MIFHSDANEAHFHVNGSALSLVFKPRFLFNMLAITAEIAQRICPMLGNPRQSSILDSGFWIPHHGSQTPITGFQSLSMKIWFRIQKFVGFRIPWAVFWIPKPRIPDSTSKFSQILDSTSKNFLHSGIRIPLHETKGFFLFHNFLMLRWMKQSIDRSKINKKMKQRLKTFYWWYSHCYFFKFRLAFLPYEGWWRNNCGKSASE